MPLHSYVEPHKYNLRCAIRAWFVRHLGGEKEFKIYFYLDELPGREVGDLLRSIVEKTGGTRQEGGRFLIARRRDSWRDICLDDGLYPSSGTLIICQGELTFLQRVSKLLETEKQKRVHPEKKRGEIIPFRRWKM